MSRIKGYSLSIVCGERPFEDGEISMLNIETS